MSTWRPPSVSIHLPGRVIRALDADPVLEEICLYANAAVGSAVLAFPGVHARSAMPAMGERAHLEIGGEIVFRGVVGQCPYTVDEQTDEVRLVLICDKWRLRGVTVGQQGIGTWDTGAGEEHIGETGFTAVGYDLVFNPAGVPNKHESVLDFDTSSNAVPWTLKDVLELLFEHYAPAGIELPEDLAELDIEYDTEPVSLELAGMDLLAAIDHVAGLAGTGWTLDPRGTDASVLRVFKAMQLPSGEARVARLFAPGGGARADQAGEMSPSSITVGPSIVEWRGTVQAVSANAVVEHTYSTLGEHPLLVHSHPGSSRFAARLAVDVTEYAEHGLGAALPPGSAPKAWMPELVTRANAAGSGYLTDLDMADPVNRGRAPLPAPLLYVALPEDPESAVLVMGGYELDLDACTIDLEPALVLATADPVENRKVEPEDFEACHFSLTVATRIEERESHVLEAYVQLDDPVTEVIRVPVTPARRGLVRLPDLASSNRNAAVIIDQSESPDYVSHVIELASIATRAIATAMIVERPVSLMFPLFPRLHIGDIIQLSGRETPTESSGAMVTEIVYRVAESYETRVRATNLPARSTAQDHERMV